jgi:hypothetical protein
MNGGKVCGFSRRERLREVHFISQVEAEKLVPVAGAAMISITDPDKQDAVLGDWEILYRDSFYDGGYTEGTIRTMKGAFRMNYSSYIDSFQAKKLSSYIDELVKTGICQVYVHCYYGQSRSGAIAMYLRDKHGFLPNKQITKPNMTVYDLLCHPTKHEPLIQSYETQDIAPPERMHNKIWDFLLVAIGFRR